LNTKKNTTTYDFGNPGPGLRQAQNVAGVKPVIGIPLSLLMPWYLQLFGP